MKKLLAIIALVAMFPLVSGASLYHYYNEQLPSIEERAIVAAEFGIWGYEGTYDQNVLLEERLRESDAIYEEGEFGYSVVSRYRTRLSSSMTSTQTTVPVSSITSFDGTTLTMALLGSKVFLTLEPGTSREEIVKCTTISSTTWATCTRGLAFTGTVETSVVANRKAHNAGSVVVMSNVHYVNEQLTDKDSDETVGGVKTYSLHPEIAGTDFASTTRQVVSFDQLNAVTNQGAATSTESLAGIGQIATKAEQSANTFDADAPTFLSTKYSSSTSANDYVVISEADGKLNQGWLDLTEAFIFTNDNSFTGTTTFATSTTASSTITQLNLGGEDANALIDDSNADLLHTHALSSLSGGDELLTTGTGSSNFSYQQWFNDDDDTQAGAAAFTIDGNYFTIDVTGNIGKIYWPLLGAGTQNEYRWDEGKDIIFQFMTKATGSGAAIFFGLSDMSGNHSTTNKDHAAGFSINGGTLNSWSDDGTTIENNDISAGVTITNWNLYRVHVRLGTDVRFYVNGALKATHTTNLPTTGTAFFGSTGASGGGGNTATVSIPLISLEL